MTTLIGALLIGATLGLLGSGGSAITVPILVYLIGHDAKISIAESMAIVGLISLAGAIPKAVAKHVDWKSVIWFGIPAMLGTYLGAWLGGLATDALQLTVFGVVVILAASVMMKNAFGQSSVDADDVVHTRRPHTFFCILKIIGEGIVVGMLTGFVGVGGGFLIVPALMMLERLPIRSAIGTSLVIISMKSAIGFAKYQHTLGTQGLSVNFETIIVFFLIGVAGCAIGQRLNTRMNQKSLKKVFAVFLVLIGGYVIFQESGNLMESPAEVPGLPIESEISQVVTTPFRPNLKRKAISMNESKAQTIEQVLLERMGVTVEDAVATTADVVDEKVASAVRSGIDVDQRLTGLGQLVEKLSEPSTVAALGELLDRLPQLAQLAKLANEMPNLLATVGDVLDSYQQRCEAEGIDVEKALTNGLHASLLLGSKLESGHLQRIGDLLGSDMLNPHAVNVVDNAAKSLTTAQQSVSDTGSKRIGMLGMLGALRNPEIQRSLAFAVEFGKCFGKNLDSNSS